MNFVLKMPIIAQMRHYSLTFESKIWYSHVMVQTVVYLLFIFSCLIAEDESFMTSCLMLE